MAINDTDYYVLVQTATHVVLATRWHRDTPTETACYCEIDREPIVGNAEDAYRALKARSTHLLVKSPAKMAEHSREFFGAR